ncbi:Neuropilin and tolloid-like protein [Schistosoma japonicum]|uniref:Neuropilin and tolloid-like protein n=1 Tax=Schistosoma japonicum TaxID=6182 RepID=A0A4Z2CQY0_SCHJA|nr:Neuropilin and tolloid-like protein [Schistosoma japonicum]
MSIKILLIQWISWCGWYHSRNWRSIIIIYFKWIVYMDLLVFLLHLNRAESNSVTDSYQYYLNHSNHRNTTTSNNNNNTNDNSSRRNYFGLNNNSLHYHHYPFPSSSSSRSFIPNLHHNNTKMSFNELHLNTNISLRLFNSGSIYHQFTNNASNIHHIFHRIERRSYSKQQQQSQSQTKVHYEPEEISTPDYTLPYQDAKCLEFIQSTEIKYIKDSSMLSGFFGMSGLPKRSTEYSFQTPNYPALYPLNIECIKVISAPSDQHRILLHFRGTFELEPESHCTTDFLEIRDGAFGFTTLLGRFCSKQVPDLGTGLISTGQYMWLRFHSDATIAHRGFQAVYRFVQAGSRKPADSVSHVQFQINLQPGKVWKLDQQYLLNKLQKLPSDVQQLPLEVALDIRSTNGTFMMLHIDHVQVPQSAAWSCQPETSFTKLTRVKCLTGEPIVFGLKTKITEKNGVTDSGLNKLSLQDPSSIIDGQHTFFEVYPGKTISQFVPPCPKITRFCDKTVGILELTKNHGSARDFYVRYPRLIIRIVIATPQMKPDLLETIKTRRNVILSSHQYYRSTNSDNDSLDASSVTSSSSSISHRHSYLRHRRQIVNNDNKINEKLQEYMPTFNFILTSLKQKSTDGKSCDKDWEACNSEVCIPKSLWCDNIFNCPQWQDEGGHCTPSSLYPDLLGPDGRPLQDTSKSAFELRKEQEQLEAEAERLAAQKLHLSILASLGLLLLIVTSTCIIMTIRRRRREQVRHLTKSKEDGHTTPHSRRVQQRLNHVLSTGDIIQINDDQLKMDYNKPRRPIFTLSNSSLTQDIQCSSNNNKNQILNMNELKKSTNHNTRTLWNSTDSVHAPLLWHRKLDDDVGDDDDNNEMKSSNQIDPNKYPNKPSLHNKIKVPSAQRLIEKETMESVQFQGVNNNNNSNSTVNNNIVNDIRNNLNNLPIGTPCSMRTINTSRNKSTQSSSLMHTYGSYHIPSCEQTGERNISLNTFIQKRINEQQSKRIGSKTESTSVMSSPQNRSNWIATNNYNKKASEELTTPTTTTTNYPHNIQHESTNQRTYHLHNTTSKDLGMINRTQSWGGGLRYDYNVHIRCNDNDNDDAVNRSPSSSHSIHQHKVQNSRQHFKPTHLSSIPRCHLYSVSNSQEHLCRMKKSDTYVSMPDVNGHHDNDLSSILYKPTNYHHTIRSINTNNIVPKITLPLTSNNTFGGITACPASCTSTKDYRPPQAKRPRIINPLLSSNTIPTTSSNIIINSTNKLYRPTTHLHNENNFKNNIVSHITSTAINCSSSSSSSDTSNSSSPLCCSGSEHSQTLSHSSCHHLHHHHHHQHHHTLHPHFQHIHSHHHMICPSIEIQNVLLPSDDKSSRNRQIYNLNDCPNNMLTYSENTSIVGNIHTNLERYKYHQDSSNNSNNDDEEEEEGDDEGGGNLREDPIRTHRLVSADHAENEEETLSKSYSKESSGSLKDDETDVENSEKFSPENSPVNSTSASETDRFKNAFISHNEPIKITVYQSEPHARRSAGASSSHSSQKQSISSHSSPIHQNYHTQNLIPTKMGNNLQIGLDEQNASETSADLIYEYEA